MEELKFPRADIVTHSMGGVIAILLVLKHLRSQASEEIKSMEVWNV